MTAPVRPRPQYRKENPFALQFTDEPERTYHSENPFYTPVGPPSPVEEAIAEPPTEPLPTGLKAVTEEIGRRVTARPPVAPVVPPVVSPEAPSVEASPEPGRSAADRLRRLGGPSLPGLSEPGPIRRGAAVGGHFIAESLGAAMRAAGRAARDPEANRLNRAKLGLPAELSEQEMRVAEWFEQTGEQMVTTAKTKTANIPGPSKRLTDVRTVGEAVEWASFTVAQGVVSSIPSLVGGAVGAAVAGPAGAFAGAMGPSYLLNQHEVRRSLIEEGVSEDTAEQLSGIVAVPMAMLDAVLPGKLGTELTTPVRKKLAGSVVRKFLTETVSNAALEGLTESGQAAIERVTTAAATGRGLTGQDLVQIFEEGVGGALTGGVLSGATSFVTTAQQAGAEPSPSETQGPAGPAERPTGPETGPERPTEGVEPLTRTGEEVPTAGESTGIVRAPTSEIRMDPARFQFKQLGTEGITGELQDVPFNEQLAGVISVWRDPADGETYVVNGHNRLELAQRKGVQEVNVQYIEADTAEEARGIGAFMNIAEGRGTPVDVAKYLRDTGLTADDLAKSGVSIKGPVARKGVALSRLAPDIFDEVATAKVPELTGVAIAEMLDDAVLQRQALQAVRGSRLSEAEVREVARQVKMAGTEDVTQETLFGTETESESLFVPRAQVAAALKKKIAQDRRLFGFVSRAGRAEELGRAGGTTIDVEAAKNIAETSATAEEIFNRLYTRSGPVASIVTEAARRVSHGETVKAVIADIYAGVGDAIQGEIEGVAGQAPAGIEEAPGGGRTAAREGVVSGIERTPEEVGPTETEQATAGQGSMFGAPESTQEPTTTGPERPAILGDRTVQENMFGSPEEVAPEQTGLFGEKEGTAAARSLQETERAMQGELDVLRERFERETDEGRRTALASQIAEREKLVNRDRAITADEMAARAVATTSPADPLLDVGTPANELDERDFGATRFGDRMAGALEVPTEAEKGRPISAPQVIKAIAGVMESAGKKLRIREGRRGVPGDARGSFDPSADVVRIREANNIPTSAHETGHALEKIVYGWQKKGPWLKPRVSSKIQKELTALGRALYGNRKPAGGYKREGWAEFVRMYVTRTALDGTSTRVSTHAPLLTAWFEDTFSTELPEVRKALDAARDLTDRYRQQGSRKRAEAGIVDTTSPREQAKKAVAGTKEFLSMTNWIDMATPLAELSKAAERETGTPLAPEEDPFVTISALRTTHDARVRQMIERGMIDIAGNNVGPALNDIKPMIQGRHLDFTIYLWAKRTLALAGDPKGARASGLSVPDARQIVTELEIPAFELAASKVYEWSDGVLNYAAQASPTFAAVVDAVRERDPGAYIPLQREFEELDQRWGKGAGTRSPVKHLRGSGRRVKDILQSLISKTSTMVSQAHKRMILDQIIRLARIPGIGEQIVEVPKSKVPAYATSVGELIEELEKRVGEMQIPGLEEANQFERANILEQTITFFLPAQTPRGSDAANPVVPIYAEGTVRWFEVPKGLYETLESVDIYRMGKIADLTLGASARLFRAGTTSLRPAFGLITNPLRDAQTLYQNTQANTNAPRVFFEWLRSMGEVALWRTTGQRTEWVDAFVRLGLEMSQPLGQDIQYTRRAARRLAEGRLVQTLDPRNWYDWFRDLVQTPEAAPRIAELRMVAKDIGWEPGQPMTFDQSLQLMNAASQVTTDFKAAGRIARIVNQSVPFHNAAIQGPRAHVRAYKRNPSKFLGRGLQMTAAALVLWWMNKDEDWYEQMDSKEKYLYWHIPFDHPVTGEPELLRIPRAFEVGGIFAALPEFLADAAYHQDPEMMKEWAASFAEAGRPPLVDIVKIDGVPVPVFENPLFVTAAEQLANREFYFDRPIVPRGQEDMPAPEQFNEYTSKVATALGNMFDASPRRIDHAIAGLFGPVGGDLIDVLGLGRTGEREGELGDLPVVGRLFQRGGALGTRPKAINEMYDLLEEAQHQQRSRRHEETEHERQLRLQLTDAQKAVSALLYVRQHTTSTDDRRQLTQQTADIARRSVTQYLAGGLSREQLVAQRQRFERWAKNVKAREEGRQR